MGRTAAIVLNHCDRENALRLVKTLSGCEEIDRIAVIDNSGIGALRPDEIENGKILIKHTPNEGYAKGNNAGVRLLEGKYGPYDFYLFANTDVEISTQAVKACLDFLCRNPDYAVAAPRMFLPDGRPHHLSGWRERTFLCDLAYSSGLLSRMVGMYRETYPPEHWRQAVSTVDCVSGALFFVRAEAFKKAGLFDERTFLFYEEDILGYRLKRLGYKEAVLNEYRFIHHEGISSVKTGLRKYLEMQKSRLYFHRAYTRLNPFQMAALYAATGLGLLECAVKPAFRLIKRQNVTEAM